VSYMMSSMDYGGCFDSPTQSCRHGDDLYCILGQSISCRRIIHVYF
uniref:Uncharacterized protein n=1 Tax=Triticum urartu TaxID=4572 RepID=A0A8R7QJY6_TRIUA